MRVLHVLHHSLPVLSGYSIRSDNILRAESALGINVAFVTAAQHAADDARPFQPSETINGVQCWRTREPGSSSLRVPLVREWRLMSALEGQVAAAIESFGPDVVHGHSPVLVGLPALRAAKAAGIPFVYEVRDLWENASVDLGKWTPRSPMYRAARAADGYVLRRADAVVTICDTLRAALAPRTGRPSKLLVVDNGVDLTAFDARRSPAGASRWNLEGKRVLAYVGTFKPYEGLELLVQALPGILRQAPDAHLLIVGAGEQDARLRRLVAQMGLDHAVTFAGTLPHKEVIDAYHAAQVMVYPRVLTLTTALTTPLKPLEAMLMKRAVIVSDIPPMRELVRDGDTGLVFKAGDTDDLAAKCLTALQSAELREKLGESARAWVVRERGWATLAKRYLPVYDELTRSSDLRRRAS